MDHFRIKRVATVNDIDVVNAVPCISKRERGGREREKE